MDRAQRFRTVSILSLLVIGCPDGGATADTDLETSSSSSTTDDPTEITTADSSSSGEPNACGDGMVEFGEACDGDLFGDETCETQGFLFGELSCSADCESFSTAGCTLSVCGDGDIDGNEPCDGDNLGDATCISEGFLAGTLACDDTCVNFDTSACEPNICNNEILEPTESCDTADLDDMTCLDLGHDDGVLACADDCSFDETACIDFICGDGVVNEIDEVCDGEDMEAVECDDMGFGAGEVVCSDACQLDFSGCCGDGDQGGTELCDDEDFGAQTCADLGNFDAGVLVCADTCDGIDTAGCTLCGDGIPEGGEGCDGEDLLGNDCTTVPGGFVDGVLTCVGCQLDTSGCHFCGNNIIDMGEDCDDEQTGADDCLSLGHTGGLLGCASSCLYDESLCTDFPVPAADELVFNEIMRDPTAVGDPNGEWFELYNPSGDTTYQLLGCTIQDDGGETFDIAFDLTIGPEDTLTFGRTNNPGFVPDFVYGGMTLGNTDDELELICAGVTVDRVAWSNPAFPAPVGASMALDPGSATAAENDDGDNWCAEVVPYFMGDLGSPGADNSGCL